MAFQIQLAEQKVKPHQVTALHLVVGFVLLAFSAIGFLVNNTVMTLPGAGTIEQQKANIGKFDTADTILTVVITLSIIILFASLFRNKWLRQPYINNTFRVVELLSLAAIAVYMLTLQLQVPAVLFGLLAATIVFSLFWENGKTTQLSVNVQHDGIKLPMTSRRRNINWTETEKVLLKHGTLTINCTDNRMYQWVTSKNEIDTNDFEAYCDAQIEAAKKHRTAEW